MNDLDILKQLMNGNHLEPKELKRADQLLFSLMISLDERLGRLPMPEDKEVKK